MTYREQVDRVRASGLNYGYRPLAWYFKRWPRSRPKPEGEHYQPSLGEVGSWVRLPNGERGQVWALAKAERGKRVWVADGREFHALRVEDLQPAEPVQQAGLMDFYNSGYDTVDTGAHDRVRIIA